MWIRKVLIFFLIERWTQPLMSILLIGNVRQCDTTADQRCPAVVGTVSWWFSVSDCLLYNFVVFLSGLWDCIANLSNTIRLVCTEPLMHRSLMLGFWSYSYFVSGSRIYLCTLHIVWHMKWILLACTETSNCSAVFLDKAIVLNHR